MAGESSAFGGDASPSSDAHLRIRGGAPLRGCIQISGAKNSALKLMAACLLTDAPLRLANVPRLTDTDYMAALLARLGATVEREVGGGVMLLHAREIVSAYASHAVVGGMRASFNVLGPLLARTGHAKVGLPGGCAIGARPVNLHLLALKAMGARIALHDGYVYAQAPRGLKGADVTFPTVSVGATEHAILAATTARGVTVLRNAACEPEIVDLAACLSSMGGRIAGAGTGTVVIDGVTSLCGGRHTVMPDRIETGSYAIAVAMTGGELNLLGGRLNLIDPLAEKLTHVGVEIEQSATGVQVRRLAGRLRACDLETSPHPGFPTDLQAQFMALMTMAEGDSHIRETVFENRFLHVAELRKLGADIVVAGDLCLVRGVPRLQGGHVAATDLRGSFGLVIAGLAASGETIVDFPHHLDRGFENVDGKLAACGASIARVTDNPTMRHARPVVAPHV